MLRKYLFICFFMVMYLNIFAYYINDEDYFSYYKKTYGIKKITEHTRLNWKTVSFFDKNGFLLQSITYRKNKMRADYRYEYSISDTLITVKSKEYLDTLYTKDYLVNKFYYNNLKQCYRYEIYSSDNLGKHFVFGDNFIYKDNQLQSYERYYERDNTMFYRTIYTYSENKKTEHTDRVYEDAVISSTPTIFIYENGKLTDKIINSGITDGFSVHWNKEFNKVHTRYSNFDKHGNWTRSYCLREKKCKKLCLKRKIEYW